jgi:tRNA pseudouridine38-40 synthase
LQVRSARKEPDGFHARFSATSRVYRYTWLCRAYASPFATRFAYHEPKTLDAERMNEAAQVFLGEHDFRALAKAEAWKGPTCRGILSAGVRRVGPHVRFDVEGTGFMQGMVRMMAGALSEVGLGRWCIEEVRRLLNEPMAARRPPMLPAHGLCLMKVNYAQTGREAAVATNKWTDEEDE